VPSLNPNALSSFSRLS